MQQTTVCLQITKNRSDEYVSRRFAPKRWQFSASRTALHPKNRKKSPFVSPPHQKHRCFEVIHRVLYLNDAKLGQTALSSAEASQKPVLVSLVFPATKVILPRTM